MKTSAKRVLKKFFWDSYDNLGLIIKGNLLWLLLSLPLVTLPGATTALFYLTRSLAAGEKTSLEHFWKGFRKYFWKSLALGIIFLVFCAIILTNNFFYQQMSEHSGKIIFFILGGLNIWIFIFSLLLSIYVLPLIVKEDISLRKSFQTSAKLVLSNPSFALAIFFQALSIMLIALFSGLGFLLFLMSMTSLFLNCALRELLSKEEDIPEKRRSLRKIFRPWE